MLVIDLRILALTTLFAVSLAAERVRVSPIGGGVGRCARALVVGLAVWGAVGAAAIPGGARVVNAVGVEPAGLCWQQSGADPQRDAIVDVAGYSLSLDCGSRTFTLAYSLAPTSAPQPAIPGRYAPFYAYVRLWLTKTGEPGCNGYGRMIAGASSPDSLYPLVAYVTDTPSCDPNTWRIIATGGYGPLIVAHALAMTFPASAIGDGDFSWWGEAPVTGYPSQPPDRFPDSGAQKTTGVPNYPNATSGYWVASASGAVYPLGDARFSGDLVGRPLAAPIVGLAATPHRDGYWLLGRDGGVFSFGAAEFHGSTGGMHLNLPVVGITSTRSGHGYWFVASDGGIFSFGDARFFGSTGAIRLNRPIVGMAATPSGLGYWLVASDGGIFSFGNARFHGSTGAIRLNRPIVGMAATKSGDGYWLVASDGGIFSFGDARFFGSTGSLRLARPITAMNVSPTGAGYRFVASDGGIFSFGDAPFYGSLAGTAAQPVVAMAG